MVQITVISCQPFSPSWRSSHPPEIVCNPVFLTMVDMGIDVVRLIQSLQHLPRDASSFECSTKLTDPMTSITGNLVRYIGTRHDTGSHRGDNKIICRCTHQGNMHLEQGNEGCSHQQQFDDRHIGLFEVGGDRSKVELLR